MHATVFPNSLQAPGRGRRRGRAGLDELCLYHTNACEPLDRNQGMGTVLRGARASKPEKGMRSTKTLIHSAAPAAAEQKSTAKTLPVRELLHHADTGSGAALGSEDAVIFENSVAYRALPGGGIEMMQPLESLAIGTAIKIMLENMSGSVIGMYFPACAKSVGPPEWQFSYLSGDKAQGGFVLDLSADCLRMKLKIERPDSLPHAQKENERKP